MHGADVTLVMEWTHLRQMVVFMPSTAATSLAGGSRSSGLASPSADGAANLPGDLLVEVGRIGLVHLDRNYSATNINTKDEGGES